MTIDLAFGSREKPVERDPYGGLLEGFAAQEIEQPLSATELAPIIGLHSVTILRWAREGRIPLRRGQ